MGAVLEEEGFEVSLFDSLVCPKTRVKEIPDFLHHGVDDDYFKDVVEKELPDIIGISCPFTAQFDNFVHAAKLVKEVSRKWAGYSNNIWQFFFNNVFKIIIIYSMVEKTRYILYPCFWTNKIIKKRYFKPFFFQNSTHV
jgi:hypothetical protein